MNADVFVTCLSIPADEGQVIVLMFLDFDGVLHSVATPVGDGRGRPYTGPPFVHAPTLVDVLGRYLPCLDIVVSSTWGRSRSLDELKRLLPPALAAQVVGSIWDHPPPRSLGRYAHIRYWLDRTYVGRTPHWIALDDDARDWPSDQLDHLVHCAAPINDRETQSTLVQRLSSRYRADEWWGSGEPPPVADLRRAHALMLAWQVRGPDRHRLLGSTRADFETRLDLLLTIYAGPTPQLGFQLGWPWQWLHLPCSLLDGESPINLMLREGLDGIRRVQDYGWGFVSKATDAVGRELPTFS